MDPGSCPPRLQYDLFERDTAVFDYIRNNMDVPDFFLRIRNDSLICLIEKIDPMPAFWMSILSIHLDAMEN